jgi:leucine dehydrogenase
METDHVVGLEGRSGNPSPITAIGVYHGIRASLKYAFGNDDISQYTFAVQGAGQTGYYLIKKLVEAKAKKIYFSEINPAHIERMNSEHPEVELVDPDKIYDLDVDVFSPCAFGAILNDVSIPRIKAKVIAGSANNVLFDEEKHGAMIKEKGIVYAPDFVINAGGLINVYHEIVGYNAEKAMRDTEKIYDRLLEIFTIAEKENTDTNTAANIYAKNRMRTINHLHANYIPY